MTVESNDSDWVILLYTCWCSTSLAWPDVFTNVSSGKWCLELTGDSFSCRAGLRFVDGPLGNKLGHNGFQTV